MSYEDPVPDRDFKSEFDKNPIDLEHKFTITMETRLFLYLGRDNDDRSFLRNLTTGEEKWFFGLHWKKDAQRIMKVMLLNHDTIFLLKKLTTLEVFHIRRKYGNGKFIKGRLAWVPDVPLSGQKPC